MAGEKVMSGNLRLTLADKTVYHSTECSLSMSREFKERATKDTDGTERAKGIKSWSASASGLAVYNGDGIESHDFYAIFDLYNDDTDAPIVIEFVPEEADATYKLVGNGFIESLENTSTNEEDGQASISITGSGAMSKEELNPA